MLSALAEMQNNIYVEKYACMHVWLGGTSGAAIAGTIFSTWYVLLQW